MKRFKGIFIFALIAILFLLFTGRSIAQEKMVMLCEAPDYVKLSFFTSGLSFIFLLWSIVYCT